MRNMTKPKPKSVEQSGAADRKIQDVSDQLAALSEIVARMGKDSNQKPVLDMAADLRASLEAIQAATAKPKSVAFHVVRDASGLITHMVATTDPKEVERILADASHIGEHWNH